MSLSITSILIYFKLKLTYSEVNRIGADNGAKQAENWMSGAERGTGVTEIGLSRSGKFCCPRSAHMLCSPLLGINRCRSQSLRYIILWDVGHGCRDRHLSSLPSYKLAARLPSAVLTIDSWCYCRGNLKIGFHVQQINTATISPVIVGLLQRARIYTYDELHIASTYRSWCWDNLQVNYRMLFWVSLFEYLFYKKIPNRRTCNTVMSSVKSSWTKIIWKK